MPTTQLVIFEAVGTRELVTEQEGRGILRTRGGLLAGHDLAVRGHTGASAIGAASTQGPTIRHDNGPMASMIR